MNSVTLLRDIFWYLGCIAEFLRRKGVAMQRQRSSNRNKPRRESVRRISGRYSDFDIYDDDHERDPSSRSPWRDTYENARLQGYRNQSRGYSDLEYEEDDRLTYRGNRASRRGYNDHNERWINNYDEQDDALENGPEYRERYKQNRY